MFSLHVNYNKKLCSCFKHKMRYQKDPLNEENLNKYIQEQIEDERYMTNVTDRNIAD